MKRGILYLLLYIAILVFMVILGHFISGDRETINAVAIIAANLLFIIIVCCRKAIPESLFKFCGFPWAVLFLCFLVSVLLAIIVSIYFIDIIPAANEKGYLNTSVLSFLGTGIITPISEEILLRGVFLFSLLSDPFFQKRKWIAILVSAAVFGVLHFSVYQSALFFCHGIFWGWLSASTNSLAPSSIMHITNNVFMLLITACSDKNSGLLFHLQSSGPLIRILLFVGIVVLLLWIICLVRRSENYKYHY